MKFDSTDKKKNKLNSRQLAAQRMKMKMAMRIGAAVLLLLILAVSVFIQVTRPDKSTAGTEGTTGWTIVKDPEYVNEMSLEAPVITHAPIAKTTIQCRVPKAQNTNPY